MSLFMGNPVLPAAAELEYLKNIGKMIPALDSLSSNQIGQMIMSLGN